MNRTNPLFALSKQKIVIIQFMLLAPLTPYQPSDIASGTDENPHSVRGVVQTMVKEGLLIKVTYGWYMLSERVLIASKEQKLLTPNIEKRTDKSEESDTSDKSDKSDGSDLTDWITTLITHPDLEMVIRARR